MKEFIAAVDIASKRDRYAELVMRDIVDIHPGHAEIGIADRIAHTYQIVWAKQAERLRYEEMENSTMTLLGRTELVNNCDLLADGTGVGDPFVEHLRGRGCFPVPIIFTSGGSAHDVYDDAGHIFGDWADQLSVRTLKEIRVPKRDLVSAGALLVEQNRIIIGKGIRHREALIAQLNGFRGEVNNQTGRRKFEAEFEELHDDLVVCFLMLAWWAIKRRPTMPEGDLLPARFSKSSWEPSDLDNSLVPDRQEYGPPRQGVQGWR